MRSVSFVSLVVSLVFLANSALAQKKPKAEKKADGPSASATWTDPTENEKSDKGPYTPHKEDSDEPADPKAGKAPDAGRKRDKLAAFGQLVIGFGKLPMENPSYDDAPSGNATVLGIQVGGRYDVSKELSVGLRIPLTTATVKQSNGVNQSTTAFGAPELFGEYRVSLNRLTSIPIGFGLGVPVAQGEPDQTSLDRAARAKDEVNRFADATTGWRDSELFQPKHLPIVVGAGIRHERRDWELHGDLKFVVAPALSTKVNRPADPSGADDVDLEHLAPVVVGVVLHPALRADARVVDEDVETPELVRGSGHSPVHRIAVGHVGGHEAEIDRQVRGPLGQAVEDRDPRPT